MLKDVLEMFKVIPLNVSKNFKLIEFFKSQTAENHGIINFPRTYVHLRCCLLNIRKLAEVLELIRACNKGEPVFITSGFRCVELNEKVGGVPHSRHRYAAAVDITAKDFDYLEGSMNFLELKDIEWYASNDRSYIHIELKRYEKPPQTLLPEKMRKK